VSGLFFGSSARAEGGLQIQFPRDSLNPGLITKGCAAINAGANSLQFCGCQWLVDPFCPACRASKGPRGEQAGLSLGLLMPTAQRTPSPVLGTSDQASPQGVALNVPADQQKVFVILDGETLETALINMPLASCPVVGMQPHCVREQNPSQEIAHSAVFCRLQHKMPVVGHELVSQHPAGVSLQSLGEDLLEGIVVLWFVKNLSPGVAPVQGVINPARFVCTSRSSHEYTISTPDPTEKSPDTFLAPASLLAHLPRAETAVPGR